jgi:hypothetical protein
MLPSGESKSSRLSMRELDRKKSTLRMITTSASAPPLISCPTTGRVMGYFYLSFLSPLERAHTRPFAGKERSKTASQLGAQLYPFLRVFSPTSQQRIFLLLLCVLVRRHYYPTGILSSSRFMLESERASGRFPLFCSSAAEMLMRQHAGGDASFLLFPLLRRSRAHQMNRRRDTDQTGACA